MQVTGNSRGGIRPLGKDDALAETRFQRAVKGDELALMTFH